jgi:hypothetical protein
MSEATAAIKDASTSAIVSVDGVAITTSAPNPSAGQAIRQTLAVGDGRDSTRTANVDTVAPTQVDPALFVRGFAQIEDICISLKRAIDLLEVPPGSETATGRLRVTLDAIAGALTLGTVTTVGTVTNITNLPTLANVTTVAAVTTANQLGGQDARTSLIHANEQQAWAALVRARIS